MGKTAGLIYLECHNDFSRNLLSNATCGHRFGRKSERAELPLDDPESPNFRRMLKELMIGVFEAVDEENNQFAPLKPLVAEVSLTKLAVAVFSWIAECDSIW